MRTHKVYTYTQSKQHTRLVTDALILQSAERYLTEYKLPKEPLSVYHDERQKPHLRSELTPLFVSASHTGKTVVVAVAEYAIGIDCEEKDRTVKCFERIVKRYFTPAERAVLDDLTDEEKRITFLKTWVKKESYVKLTGEGLAGMCEAETRNPTAEVQFEEADVPGCFSVVCYRQG